MTNMSINEQIKSKRERNYLLKEKLNGFCVLNSWSKRNPKWKNKIEALLTRQKKPTIKVGNQDFCTAIKKKHEMSHSRLLLLLFSTLRLKHSRVNNFFIFLNTFFLNLSIFRMRYENLLF